jgi:hypothetical protein
MLSNKITKNPKTIQSLSHPSGCPNNGVHRPIGWQFVPLPAINEFEEKVNKSIKDVLKSHCGVLVAYC